MTNNKHGNVFTSLNRGNQGRENNKLNTNTNPLNIYLFYLKMSFITLSSKLLLNTGHRASMITSMETSLEQETFVCETFSKANFSICKMKKKENKTVTSWEKKILEQNILQ